MTSYCESFEVVRCGIVNCFRDERKNFVKALGEKISSCILVFNGAVEVVHEFISEGFEGEGAFNAF